MGVACVANAARCGRTHCYLTGPFFLAIGGGHGGPRDRRDLGGQPRWLWIGAAIAVGTVVLWIVPERLFGRFLTDDRSG